MFAAQRSADVFFAISPFSPFLSFHFHIAATLSIFRHFRHFFFAEPFALMPCY